MIVSFNLEKNHKCKSIRPSNGLMNISKFTKENWKIFIITSCKWVNPRNRRSKIKLLSMRLKALLMSIDTHYFLFKIHIFFPFLAKSRGIINIKRWLTYSFFCDSFISDKPKENSRFPQEVLYPMSMFIAVYVWMLLINRE